MILQRAAELAPRLTELRRVVHRHPELGFQEHKTAALVADTLRLLGVRMETGVGRTGVVGHMGVEGPVVALRADMDALPIQEQNQTDYASQIPGVMHACGHDAHVACLLGAAMLLSEMELKGQVRLLFQPSEEGMDDEGKSGARRMIEDGAADGVDAIFGLHVDGRHPSGVVACSSGPVLASMDNFAISIYGQGAHGAQAYLGVDAILLAAQVVNVLHTVISRRIPALDNGVISIGTIHGGTKENNLAARVELRGTIRSFDPEVRQTLFREIDRACGIAKAMGGDYHLSIQEGYPSLTNDPILTTFARETLCDLAGPEAVQDVKAEMGAEDFSFFTQTMPGCYMTLGVGMVGCPVRPQHHPNFDIDESALPLGAAALAQLASQYLEQKSLKGGKSTAKSILSPHSRRGSIDPPIPRDQTEQSEKPILSRGAPMAFEERFRLLVESGQANERSVAAARTALEMVATHHRLDLTEESGASLASHVAITIRRLLDGESLHKVPDVVWQELKDHPDDLALARAIVAELERDLALSIAPDEVGFIAVHLCKIRESVVPGER